MKVGIVGMPNAGKSSLFNALTRAGAEAANYPFTTIEPNVAVVPVRDDRLDQVAATIGASNIVYDTIDFHDIAGLVRGRPRGRGPRATSSWPTSARPTRSSTSCAPTTTRTSSTRRARSIRCATSTRSRPSCIYADLEQAERRLERVDQAGARRRQAARGAEERVAARGRSTRCRRAARCAPCRCPPTRRTRCATCTPLTAKPVLFVANVDEGDDEVPPAVADHAAADGALARRGLLAPGGRALRARRRRRGADARASWASARPACERVVDGAFALLRPDRVLHRRRGQAGAVLAPARGLTAWHAAGAIHTDIQKGFVRAEVIGWEALVDAGGYAGARERGDAAARGSRLRRWPTATSSRSSSLHDGAASSAGHGRRTRHRPRGGAAARR